MWGHPRTPPWGLWGKSETRWKRRLCSIPHSLICGLWGRTRQCRQPRGAGSDSPTSGSCRSVRFCISESPWEPGEARRGEEKEAGERRVWGGAEKGMWEMHPSMKLVPRRPGDGGSCHPVPEWTLAPVTQAPALSPRGSQAPRPSSAAPGTHVWVSIPEEFVEHVAELPAEHCVAGQRQPVDNRPKGLRSLLVVGAQYARWGRVMENKGTDGACLGTNPGWGRQQAATGVVPYSWCTIQQGAPLVTKALRIWVGILAIFWRMAKRHLILIKFILLDDFPRDGSLLGGVTFSNLQSKFWASSGPGWPFVGRCFDWN